MKEKQFDKFAIPIAAFAGIQTRDRPLQMALNKSML